jgi:hypothetical protein
MWTANPGDWHSAGKRRQRGFEIIVDGKTRSFRDGRDAVIEAGKYLTAHHRQSEISIRNNSSTIIGWEKGEAFIPP